MIRPLTAACMLLACGSGLYLYQAKHRTRVLDHEIAATLQATDAARQRSGVLQAEWTLLNDPERLAGLAARFLTLQTTQPSQFTTMAELNRRLPSVRPPEAPPQTTDEPPDTPVSGPAAQSPAQASPAQSGPAPPGPASPPSAGPPATAPVAQAQPVAPGISTPGTSPTATPSARPGAPIVTSARAGTEHGHGAGKPASERLASEHPTSERAREEHQNTEASPHDEPRGGGSLLGFAHAPTGVPVPAVTPATSRYAAGLVPQPAAVYTPSPQPVASPGFTQSALGMARTGSAAPFASPYNTPNGN